MREFVRNIDSENQNEDKQLNQLPQNHKLQKVSKIIYWSIVILAVLHLLFLSLPLFLNTEQLINLKGEQTLLVMTKGQSSSFSRSIVVVRKLDDNDLATGNYIILYNATDDYYIEKQITSYSSGASTFYASYSNQIEDEYNVSDIVGVYKKDANFIQLLSYSSSTPLGYTSTAIVYVIVLSLSYIIFIKNPSEGDKHE